MRDILRRVPLLLALASAAAASAAAQREAPPPVGTPKDLRLPARRTVTLPNGMRLEMVPFGLVPKATVRLVVDGGSSGERADEVGLAGLAAAMLREGTTTRSGADVATAFASMGGSLTTNTGFEAVNVITDVLAERAADAVRLVAEVVRRPAFAEADFARVRANRLRDLAITLSTPQTQAQVRFASLLFGDHPWGRTYPTEAALAGYTVAQTRDFWRRSSGAARARLYVAGVFDAAAVERAAREAFGDWEPGTPAPPVPAAQPAERRQLALIDRPDAPQSTIVLGLAVPDPTAGDWVALEVTDALLGGAFGSRITSNIREDKGYTYSPYSTFRVARGGTFWAEIADVTTSETGASLREIFAEIDRLHREPPPADELRSIENNRAGIFTLQNASRGGVINRLVFVDRYALGDAYLASYVRNVLAVTPETVQRIARTYLRPERMTIVVVGDKKTVASQIAPYGGVTP